MHTAVLAYSGSPLPRTFYARASSASGLAANPLCLLFLLLPVCAHANVPALAPIVIRDDGATPVLPHVTVESARADAAQQPGNVSVIDADDYRQSALLSLRDALSRSAGVFVQNPSGQDRAQLSIRGSGISTLYGLRGVRLLRDGLPLTRSDDYSDTAYLDPETAQLIEVYRGANALAYGASTLGGAINAISPTGYTLSGRELRLQVGSHGYRRATLRAGGVLDNGLDGYMAITGMRADGFREQSGQSIGRFQGSVGYQFSPRAEGRLSLTLERQRVDMPGPLSMQQLLDDPTQVAPGIRRTSAAVHTRPRSHVAYQHTLLLGDTDKLSMGAYYTHTRFDYPNAIMQLRHASTDYGVAWRHEVNRSWAGRDNRFVWGGMLGRGSGVNNTYGPVYLNNVLLDPRTGMLQDVDGTRHNIELYARNHTQLTPTLAVVVGAQAVSAYRSVRSYNPVPLVPNHPFAATGNTSAHYRAISPMAGLIWQPAGDAQFFTNLSRSAEPPTGVDFHTVVGTLEAQRATTLEVGTRGGDNAFAWELALYRSRVSQELLSIESPPGSGRMIASNIDSTWHSGVELTLNGTFAPAGLPGELAWGLAYTWNDFRFANDPTFGRNALPGIPRHYARLDLSYRHPSGFYAGPSLELASSRPVDQANTLYAPGYGIINLTVGYAAPNGRYRLYLDARNLTDRHYVASTDYVVNARGRDMLAFYPSLTRSLYAGVQFQW